MKTKTITTTMLVVIGLAAFLAFTPPAHAQVSEVCDQLQNVASCDPSALESTVGKIANTLIFIVGAVAVVVLIIAGLMYVLSAGNPEQTKRAKDAIIYAAVGLVVAILSFAIVNFVLGQFV